MRDELLGDTEVWRLVLRVLVHGFGREQTCDDRGRLAVQRVTRNVVVIQYYICTDGHARDSEDSKAIAVYLQLLIRHCGEKCTVI